MLALVFNGMEFGIHELVQKQRRLDSPSYRSNILQEEERQAMANSNTYANFIVWE